MKVAEPIQDRLYKISEEARAARCWPRAVWTAATSGGLAIRCRGWVSPGSSHRSPPQPLLNVGEVVPAAPADLVTGRPGAVPVHLVKGFGRDLQDRSEFAVTQVLP